MQMIYEKERFEAYQLEQLQATKEQLEEWKSNPYLLDESITTKFWNEVKKAPMVAIIGDYDVDGETATYIMGKSIKSVCPDKKIFMRIPRRFSEGYGINDKIADEVMEKCPIGTVVVTVDNGIAAANVLERLEANGYPVLLTDHHQKKDSDRIPNVTMAIDPVVEGMNTGFSFKNWCGAAVAFKLCEQYIPETLVKELECFAGIATIADAVELREANWGLAKKTIDTFRAGKAPLQLTNLLIGLKQDPLFIDEEAIGWYLAPCLNAPGRLEDKGGSQVLSYFFAPNEEKLLFIIECNYKRKRLKEEQTEQIIQRIEAQGKENDCPIWIVAPGLHEGLLGIYAGKVAEKYGVPAIIGTFVDEQQSIVKASGRTVGDFNLFSYLQLEIAKSVVLSGKYGVFSESMPKQEKDAIIDVSLKDWFLKFGGHAAAIGLSMDYDKFEQASKVQMPKPTMEAPPQTLISTKHIPEISQILNKYRPFGSGHAAPNFALEFDFNGENGRMVGNEKNHLMAGPNDRTYKIQHFFHDPNALSDKEHFGMIGNIGDTSFQGIETPTFKVEDVYDLQAEREIESDTARDHIR